MLRQGAMSFDCPNPSLHTKVDDYRSMLIAKLSIGVTVATILIQNLKLGLLVFVIGSRGCVSRELPVRGQV